MTNSFRAKRLILICLLLATTTFTVMIAGCKSAKEAGGPGQNQAKFLDAAGMQKEYREAAAKLELPPGIIFHKEANTGGAKSFEKGVGRSYAQAYWISAWETEWLEQRNKDQVRARKALDVLKNDVPKSEFMTTLDEPGRRFYADYLKKAELGDPSGFQQDVTVNPVRLERIKND